MDFILFRGQKRNGNHLLINWLLLHYGPNHFFHNDCWPFDKEIDVNYVKNIINNIKPNYSCALLSIENIQHTKEKDIHDIKNYIKADNIYMPFILRDPYNWYISNLFREVGTEDPVEYAIKNNERFWFLYENAIDSWLKSEIQINYNKFVASTEYRKNLITKFKIKFNASKDTEALNTLWKPNDNHIASSFNNKKVLNRYKEYNYIIKKIKVPNKIQKLAKIHFPEMHEIKI